jgi:glycosyltransferase involved in cell wall biosynthesis
MRVFVDCLLYALALGLGLMTLAFFVQATAVLLCRHTKMPMASVRPRVAVLVPAHDEHAGIGALVEHIRLHLRPSDRLLVVADNCQDETATIAADHGAEVLVRDDPKRRGKGFALAAGLRHLAQVPPEVVVFVDADCRFDLEGVDLIARACAACDAPVQCRNLMLAAREEP